MKNYLKIFILYNFMKMNSDNVMIGLGILGIIVVLISIIGIFI